MEEFIEKYVGEDLGIQPEYAMSVVGNVRGTYAYRGSDPYAEPLRRCEELFAEIGLTLPETLPEPREEIRRGGQEGAAALLEEAEKAIASLKSEKEALDGEITMRKQLLTQILELNDLDADLETLFNMRFFKIRIGRLTRRNFERLMLYAADLDTLIIHIKTAGDYEHLLYIMPESAAVRVDGVFTSLQFERSFIPEGVSGTPKEIIASLNAEISEKNARSAKLAAGVAGIAEGYRERLLETYGFLKERSGIHEIVKYAAFTHDSFRLIGWMPEASYNRIAPELNRDPNVIVVADDGGAAGKAPTRLKNNAVFRAFEPIVTMYGLPAYNEIDPTPIVAILYCLMVGFMFGDVGQGLIFFLAGLVLLAKKSALGGIFTGGGLMAMFFGFMYGSIFSIEGLLPPLFMNPMENANINTMLVIGIAFGVLMLLLGMVLNILNGIKAKDFGRVLFDRNGVAGMLFYLAVISAVVSLFFFGKLWTSVAVLAVCLLIPLLVIYFRQPLENLIKKKPVMPEGISGFLIETSFEMVDMLLGFASNTISFVRLSAFAINHVGLSMAVNILAEMPSGIVGKTVIMVIGNAAIIVLEGMVVGIQGLRLTYYELFSRFYRGDGVPYRPASGSAPQQENGGKKTAKRRQAAGQRPATQQGISPR